MGWVAKESIYAFFREMRKGYKAVITQSYTEANVKNGVQFQYATYVELPVNGEKFFIFKTGNKPVAMKGRTFQYDGVGISVEIFVNPTYTGGTKDFVYGLNSIHQENPTTEIWYDPAHTDLGVPGLPKRHYLGSNAGGNRTSATISEDVFGLETILAPNTDYLLRLESLDTADTQRVSVYFTWYEGFFDLPST